MARKDSLIHEREYTHDKTSNCYFPILEIALGDNRSKKKIPALVDTGCTPDIHLCQAYIEREKLLLGKKINKEPEKVSVADGHKINADLYEAICEINGKQFEVIVCVTDPTRFFEEEEPEIEITEPLLGRGVLDNYDVTFMGKRRRLLLFRPDQDQTSNK